MKIIAKKTLPNAILPTRATAGATGLDLYAAESVTVKMTMTAVVDTGIQLDLSDTPVDLDVQVRPRSGLAAKYGITVLNSPGTIDRDYQGNIKVILVNHGEADYTIKVGERIAQLVLGTVKSTGEIEEAGELTANVTARGEGGLGSTGTL